MKMSRIGEVDVGVIVRNNVQVGLKWELFNSISTTVNDDDDTVWCVRDVAFMKEGFANFYSVVDVKIVGEKTFSKRNDAMNWVRRKQTLIQL